MLPRRRAAEDPPLDAVAAPDGTELFFCATDRSGLPNWRADFEDVRVFCEVVQRDGHRGYGAQNAPVRLAAQHGVTGG